jgi:transposase
MPQRPTISVSVHRPLCIAAERLVLTFRLHHHAVRCSGTGAREVVGQCDQRHRHQEFLKFLRRLDQEFPAPVPLHLVMDNYGTHKKEEVHTWLKKHPRFALHFVPTSSSWLNLVERWFGELSRQCIRRGAFFSIEDLQKAIQEFLDAWNENPKPFVWTATVESIMEKLSRCRETLEKIQPGCTSPRSRKKSNKVV